MSGNDGLIRGVPKLRRGDGNYEIKRESGGDNRLGIGHRSSCGLFVC